MDQPGTRNGHATAAAPFDTARLDRLMGAAGLDLLIATSQPVVRYLLGGYRAGFFAHADAIGQSRYLPVYLYPAGAPERARYIGHRLESWQLEVEPPPVAQAEASANGSADAMRRAIGGYAHRPPAPACIGVEMPFLPADAHAVLRGAFPSARIVDAVPKSPEIREVLRGIGHAHRRDPRQAAALTTPEIQKLVRACGHDLAGLRDRALILVGFAGALRRSEMVALGRRHVQWTARGMTLRIARSKTDSEGKDIGIPLGRHAETCPVTHLRRWVAAARIEDDALFRRVDRWGKAGSKPMNPDSVRLVLARLAAAAGMVGTPLEPISPHGLHHHGLRQRRV